MAILEYALLSAPGAPLKQALLDAGIGKDILGSFESGIQQPSLSVVAKNANVGDKEKFLAVIRKVLEEQVKTASIKKHCWQVSILPSSVFVRQITALIRRA